MTLTINNQTENPTDNKSTGSSNPRKKTRTKQFSEPTTPIQKLKKKHKAKYNIAFH